MCKPEPPKGYAMYESESIKRDPETLFPKDKPGEYYRKKFRNLYACIIVLFLMNLCLFFLVLDLL